MSDLRRVCMPRLTCWASITGVGPTLITVGDTVQRPGGGIRRAVQARFEAQIR